MIKLVTPCNECIHSNICKNKNQAETAAERLKKMTFDKSRYDCYNWEDISSTLRFDISFECRDFLRMEKERKIK